MASNINALLDKAEDPEKMIDQCLRNLNSDLGKVKSETASVMAEEQRTKRELDECTAEINKMQTYAMKAVQSGNDDDAKKFLERKATLTAKQSSLTQSYQLASQNAANMRQMHDKLVGDINQLESRKDMIKSKIAVAKTQERINSIGSSVNSANNSISAFDRMEEKADKMLDKANAMAELNKGPVDDMADLTAKYSDTSNIDDELAALKASLNQ
ncbi:PspA/IM30 family protein [Anaeromicropila herbilytica]